MTRIVYMMFDDMEVHGGRVGVFQYIKPSSIACLFILK